jgi:hypothetical protein
LEAARKSSHALQGSIAPAPAPVTGPPTLPKASDALALTNSTLNQLQVLFSLRQLCIGSGM